MQVTHVCGVLFWAKLHLPHVLTLSFASCVRRFLAFHLVWLIGLFTSVKNGSVDVLEHILSHDECDVDPENNLTKETPLHYAVKLEDHKLRRHIMESLLDAGADTRYVFSIRVTISMFVLNASSSRIKDKEGDTVTDILRPDKPDDKEILALIRKAQAQNTISHNDIADGEYNLVANLSIILTTFSQKMTMMMTGQFLNK